MRTSTQDEVMILTLDRPERRNAIDAAMRNTLARALDDAARDPLVRAIVITGAGGSFCSGGDLGAFEDLHDPRVYRHVSHQLTGLMDAVERLEKPVIAAIDGVATGAGLTLALCCDWRIATPAARLLFREGRLGLVPTHGGVSRLVKLVGLGRAQQALLGGEDLDAHAALTLGLVTEVIDGDPVHAACQRARRMLQRAPLSYAAVKRLLHLAADTDVRSGMLAESLAQTALLGSDEHREGLAAARERRMPEFAGRLATIIELDGIAPTIGEGVFLAPTAVLVGDVRVGDRANIWFGAVLRGDSARIDIGAECSIQDNAVIHCAHELPTVVGARVTVGHGALLEGCVIEDEALIGMGAIVLQHARIGAGAMVAAGTVVPERAEVRPGVLSAGVPAREKKELSGSALRWTRIAADVYQQYSKRYMTASRVHVTDDAPVA